MLALKTMYTTQSGMKSIKMQTNKESKNVFPTTSMSRNLNWEGADITEKRSIEI